MLATRIIATVGPASAEPRTLTAFMDAGAVLFRLNLSHGKRDDHQRLLDAVRQAASERDQLVATIADLGGPKIRTLEMDESDAAIEVGDECRIVREIEIGTAREFATTYPGLVDEVEIGHALLIDDGAIRLQVTAKKDDALVCHCEAGGVIGTRKGINVPDSDLTLPALTDKDRADLAWALEQEVEFLALSFVRRAADVELLRDLLNESGSDARIITKVETPQAIANLDDIIKSSDAILVARGDLGVEMEVSRIPLLQKDMVERCRRLGKPVIIATQMLHSMTDSPTPTRAEVSDVANAVLDGADAVMLSAESAVGRYPVPAVSMMARIIRQVHDFQHDESEEAFQVHPARLHVGSAVDATTSALARSAVVVARDLSASLMVVWTRTGRTARWISKYQPRRSVIALSDRPRDAARLLLSYGVQPVLVPEDYVERGATWSELQAWLERSWRLHAGELVVLVGDPSSPTRAPTISIQVVTDGGAMRNSPS